MSNIKLSSFLPISILLISVTSIPSLVYLGVYAPWIVSLYVLFFFGSIIYFSKNKQSYFFIQVLLIYYTFSITRGFFIAENYWDWKGLIGNALRLLIPIVAFTSLNINMVRKIMVFYIKYVFPLFIIIIFFTEPTQIGAFLAPISILSLFFYYFSKKWQIILLSVTILVIYVAATSRSTVILFLTPLLFMSLYYFRKLNLIPYMELVRNIFFVLPIVFLLLAVYGSFNVFRMDKYLDSEKFIVSGVNSEGLATGKEDLTADTRTGIYREVLLSARKHDSWWIGRSPARGNESSIFGKEMKKITGRSERLMNEVGILNIFTWTGILGVILRLTVFYVASFLAINKSKNMFIKIIGLFVAFRWMYSWVEDIGNFNSSTFFLWILIGLCYSKSFRKMTDIEVKLWIKGIPYKKQGNKILLTRIN